MNPYNCCECHRKNIRLEFLTDPTLKLMNSEHNASVHIQVRLDLFLVNLIQKDCPPTWFSLSCKSILIFTVVMKMPPVLVKRPPGLPAISLILFMTRGTTWQNYS